MRLWHALLMLASLANAPGCSTGRGYLEECTEDQDCACPLRCDRAWIVWGLPVPERGQCDFPAGPRELPEPALFRSECAVTEPHQQGEYCGADSDCACPLVCVFSLRRAEQRGRVPVCGVETEDNISFNATLCSMR